MGMESQSDSDSSEDLLPSLAGRTIKIRKGQRRDQSSTQSSTSDHTSSDRTFSGSECSETSTASEEGDYGGVRGRVAKGTAGRGGRSVGGRSLGGMRKSPSWSPVAMAPKSPIAMASKSPVAMASKRQGRGRPPKRRISRTPVKMSTTESSDSSDGDGEGEGAGGEEWEGGVRRSNRSTRGKVRRRWSGSDDQFLSQAPKRKKSNLSHSQGEPNLLSAILADIPEVDIRPTGLTESKPADKQPRDSKPSVFSPTLSVAGNNTNAATAARVSDRGDSEDIEGDGSMTNHCNRLLSWERDVARGSEAMRGPTLYAAERLSVELAEIKGSWMDKARFIARTWRRVPAEERDVFTERAKQNRKLLTAAGKIKSTPKLQKNAFDSAQPSQIIHHRPSYTAPTPLSNVTSPTLADFTQTFGEEAPEAAPSDSRGANVGSKKQPSHSITHAPPKSSNNSRSGSASHSSPNAKNVKTEDKPTASMPIAPILSPAIPFTPTVFSCLQPGALFPAAFPLQFSSIPPNAFQMLAGDSQSVPFLQPAMSPIAISIPFPLQSNPSMQLAALPPTGASNAPPEDSAQIIKSKKTDDLCSAVDKQIETLAETLSVSPNGNPPFPPPVCPVNRPHSTSVPSTMQAGSPTNSMQPNTHLYSQKPAALPNRVSETPSTPSIGNVANSISSPTKLPRLQRDTSTQEMQASPSKLAPTVLPSPSEISDFCVNLNPSFPPPNVTMAANSDTTPTSSCEGTTDTSSQQFANSSLSRSSASSSFKNIATAPAKTKNSSKDRPAKEKKRPTNHHTQKTVIQGNSAKLESPVHSSSKRRVCLPPQVSTDASDEMALPKLGEDTVTPTLELPPEKRPLNSDLSPLQTSLTSSCPEGATYSTITAVASNTIGSLFPNLLQDGALGSRNRASVTAASSVPSAMPLSVADTAVSTTQSKIPSLGLPQHPSALPLSSSQPSHAVTPSILQGTRKTTPMPSSSTNPAVISTKSRQEQSERKPQQSGLRSAVATSSEGTTTSKPVIQASSTSNVSLVVESEHGCIPSALPFIGVSKAPLLPTVMATSNKSIMPSGAVFPSSIPSLPFSILHAKMLPTAFIPQFSLPTVSSLSEQREGTASPSIVTASLSSIPSATAHSGDYKQNIPKKVPELNLTSRKRQKSAGDRVAEPVTTFPHIVEAFSSKKRRKSKEASGNAAEDPLAEEKGKGKSKHSKKYRKKSGRSSISSTDSAAAMHVATTPIVQDRFRVVGTELHPMMSAPLAPPEEPPLLPNLAPLVASTPKCFGDVGKGSVHARLPKQHTAQSPVASLSEGRAATTGSPTLLMNPFVADLGEDQAEIERLYLHNLALLKQQEQYTKMLEQHLLKLQRESKSSRKPSKMDVYRQFLSFVVEPNCIPDIPISIPGFNSESSQEIELKGTFDKPILSSTHNVYASFGHT